MVNIELSRRGTLVRKTTAVLFKTHSALCEWNQLSVSWHRTELIGHQSQE